MSSAAELVRSFYAAFARGDVGGVLGGLADDVVWNEAENFPYADGNPYHGPAAVGAGIFGRIVAEWDGFVVAVEEVLDAGERIVVLGRYGGVYKRTGRAVDAQFAHVWTVRGGKAATFQQYADTLQFARAIQPETVAA
jgi:ketosteroid isomerase-like protein